MQKSWEDLRAAGAASLSRTLGDLVKNFQEAAATAYKAQGWTGLSLVHVQFLSNVDETGTRLTEVAKGMGATKQYVGRLAQDLAGQGLVELVPEDKDRRAVLARPLPRGREFLEMACEVRSQLESSFSAKLVGDQPRQLTEILKRLTAR